MVDRGEGDVARYALSTGDRKGDDLGACRSEFASEGFVSGTDDDVGSFGGEFHQRITEGQDDVVAAVASGQSPGAGCTVAMRVVGISVSPRRGSRRPTAMIGPVTR